METKKRLIYADDAERSLFALRKGFRKVEEKCAVGACILELQNVLTIDAVEVVHGRWLNAQMENHDPFGCYMGEVDVFTCSVCGVQFDVSECRNYCPSCGAKMDLQ